MQKSIILNFTFAIGGRRHLENTLLLVFEIHLMFSKQIRHFKSENASFKSKNASFLRLNHQQPSAEREVPA